MKREKLQLPTEGAFWRDGVCTIDGVDAKGLVERCVARGLAKLGRNVYPMDNKPLNDHTTQKNKLPKTVKKKAK